MASNEEAVFDTGTKQKTHSEKTESEVSKDREEVMKIAKKLTPLFDMFPPTQNEENEVSSDDEPDIPQIKDGSEAETAAFDRVVCIKQLKKVRTTSYRCITKMSKMLPTDTSTKDLAYWKSLLEKLSNERDRLIDITLKLKTYEPDTPESEKVKATQYLKTLSSTMANVADYITAAELNFESSMELARDCLKRGVRLSDPSELESTLLAEYARVNRELDKLNRKIHLGSDSSSKELEPNYQGLKRIEPKKFGGDESTFHFWKEQFLASVKGRNLDKTHLALMLYDCLEGKAEKACHNHVRARIDHHTYDLMWEVLEKRFGGDYREDQFVTDQFEKTVPLREFSLKELERMYDIFSVQQNYYNRLDKNALTNPRSLLMKQAKRKFTSEQSFDYLKYIQDTKKSDCFQSLVQWLDQKLTFVQRAEREFLNTKPHLSNDKSKNHKQVFQTFKMTQISSESEDEFEPGGSELFHLEQKMEELASCFNMYRNKKDKPQKGRVAPQTQFNGFKNLKFSNVPLSNSNCPLCPEENHKVENCPRFTKLNFKRRQSALKTLGLCWHCLMGNHKVRNCKVNTKKLCGVNGCVRYHHPLLHPEDDSTFFEDRDSTCSDIPDFDLDDIDQYHVASPGSISLQTLVCNLNGKRNNFPVVALLDSGASSTLINEALANDLGLPVKLGPMKRKVNYADRKAEMQSSLVEFQISSLDGLNTQVCYGWTVKDLAKNTGIVDWSIQKSEFSHLKKVPFAMLPKDPVISVLIGTDNRKLFKPTKVVDNPENENDPWAVLTPLGWTCIGSSSKTGQKSKSSSLHNIHMKDVVFQNILFYSSTSTQK